MIAESQQNRFSLLKQSVTRFELMELGPMFANCAATGECDPYAPVQLGSHVLLILEEGAVNHLVDFERVALKEGEALLLVKGQVHAFDRNAEYHGFMLVFSEEVLKRTIAPCTLAQLEPRFDYFEREVKFTYVASNMRFLMNIMDQMKGAAPSDVDPVVGAMLSVFLLRSRSDRGNELTISQKHLATYFMRMKDELTQMYTRERRANYYADELCIHIDDLDEVTQEWAGMDAQDYVDRYVLLMTQRALVSSPYSHETIAQEQGFADASELSAFMRAQTGLSTEAFLESISA